ncbi:MAG: DUF169 domain-containing protein [Methanotrichaceae archaeon]
MVLDEMAKCLKDSLELTFNPVGVALFRREEDIPDNIEEIKENRRHCQMVLGAGRDGEVYLATKDTHACKGGATGIGLIDWPLNISSGNLYLSKLHKNVIQGVARRVVAAMPRPAPGSTVATLIGPLENMKTTPDVVIFVGKPFQARRIIQAVVYKHGGRLSFNSAVIQSFCVDATAVPYLTGNVNISMGCDGAAKNAGLKDDEVVVGIPFELLEDIYTVFNEHHEGWDAWMRS